MRLNSSSCCSKLKPRSFLPVATRQLREAATALMLFFFVAMDEKGWGHYAHGRVALQEIHGVESGLPACVGQVLEVPAHEEFDPRACADRDMPGIVIKHNRHHIMREIGNR